MNHYQTLGIMPSARFDEVKSAFRKLAVQHHPDKGGDSLLFTAVQQAFSILSDAQKRAEYDSSLKQRPIHDIFESAKKITHEYLARL
jgi:curved DNA-binding protein CbpA